MNTQFHTPSFGDEYVDVQQQQTIQTKRVRSGMENSLDEYQSEAHDETTTAQYNNSVMGQHSPNSMMGGGAVIVPNTSPGATTTLAARKQMAASGGVDPNEPPKPLSPYALFFRDTVSAIKQQNPNCSFTELSRIVASMWEALDPVHKNVYQKKNEVARNEYVKQLRLYRQQQVEQQQQLPVATEQLTGNANSLQTRPAVFTIARANAEVPVANNYNNNNNSTNNNALIAQQQQQQQQQQYVNQQQQLTNSIVQPSQQQQQQQQLYIQQQQEEASTMNNGASVVVQSNDPSPQQMQLLTEAGSVQKCTRENCNKRAIINPDWEDEYCSNECVVIHCRNVFNGWVQSNLEARKQ